MKWINIFLFLSFVVSAVPNCSSDIKQSKTDDKQTTVPSVEKKVTFVELGSVKCIPCKMMQPIMQDIEKEYSKEVKVVFYDVWTDEGRPYAIQYKIRVIPTQVFLDAEGKEFFRHEGYYPKEAIVKLLKTKGIGQ